MATEAASKYDAGTKLVVLIIDRRFPEMTAGTRNFSPHAYDKFFFRCVLMLRTLFVRKRQEAALKK